MKINWKVRFQHKSFLVALFSLILLLIQQVAVVFGYEIPVALSEQVISIINTVLSILVLMGVIVDPTTANISDSKRALHYNEPRKDT